MYQKNKELNFTIHLRGYVCVYFFIKAQPFVLLCMGIKVQNFIKRSLTVHRDLWPNWYCNLNQKSSPQSNTTFYPQFLGISDFSNQFRFHWRFFKSTFHFTRKVLVTHLLKYFKSTNHFFHSFMVNLTRNTIKCDSSPPCEQWCLSTFTKYFRIKCIRNNMNVRVANQLRWCRRNDFGLLAKWPTV